MITNLRARKFWLFLFSASFVSFSLMVGSLNAAPRCGGTERWQVKVGTDPDASLVNVSVPVTISIPDMNQLPQRRDDVPAGDHQFRLDAERVVYKVMGRLILFKNEEDRDYHLVITDDSLRYTNGGKASDGKETGTSFIAEIPDPKCYAGKKGDPAARSHFTQQLKAVRDEFELRFPGGEGADTKLGGIPVTLTGVAFYDRMHYQTGRAKNGIELHPVLDIQFHEDTTPSMGDVSSDLRENIIVNPGFENGAEGWIASSGIIGTGGYPDPHKGAGKATLGGYGARASDALYQRVSIPTRVNKITLKFGLRVRTDEDADMGLAKDTLKLQIRDNAGNWLKTLATYSNLDASPRFKTKKVDLTAFRGKAIRVHFVSQEDSRNVTAFMLDDFELIAE